MKYVRNILLFGLAGCQSGNVTGADTAHQFAIECVGKATFSDSISGETKTREYDLPPKIYVFDEVAKDVKQALMPRHQYEDVCFRGGYIDTRDFSPGLIQVTSERQGARCDFKVNRKTGAAKHFSVRDLPNGTTSQIQFDMTCKPTEIPNFETSENLF